MRHEPQSEPFVGQARFYYYIENSFFRICLDQADGEGLGLSDCGKARRGIVFSLVHGHFEE